jgi:multicomponent Na+:H+ antiporter subunit D
MLTGVLGAVAQNQFRRILSFHIVSQIGYMIMGLGIFTPLGLAGSIFYIFHHIIVKTNLFLVSGAAYQLQGSYELKKMGGLYRVSPWLAILFLIPALSLAGMPPLSGFWAKLILLKAGFETRNYLIVAVALLVSLLTLFSMTKIWTEVFWKNAPAINDPGALRVTRNQGPGSRALLLLPIVALAALTMLIGLAAEPFMILATRAAEQLINPTEYINSVLGGIP